MRTNNYSVLRALGVLLMASLLHACGSGSGASTEANPVTTTPDVTTYNGPPPATADVQAFRLNVWDNLVPNNRCGECHRDSQSPRFVRDDDINIAYDIANTVVNLQDPGDSLLVSQVAGGHFCWLSSNQACADIMTTYIEGWAGNTFGGEGQTVNLEPPPIQDPGSSRNLPSDVPAEFSAVHDILTTYCSDCHTESAPVAQSPFLGAADAQASYDAARTRIDLDNPAQSRLVVRLREESHNCWDVCSDNADEMQAAIQSLAESIPLTEVNPDLVTSKALTLFDGVLASTGGRHEANAIALYEFRTGEGNMAFDTSGVSPALNLTLTGDFEWIGGFGIQFTDGKAQGSTTASAKLQDLITSTNEYSVEVWVAPGNVTQDGPARIVTYSGGQDARNFMLGQTLYSYDTFNRSDQTDPGGEPQLSTPDDDELLQASLQHVVMTYSPVDGRRIFVNGEFTGDIDTVPGGLLNDWDDTFALAIASEVDNNDRFAGAVRLLAIHNRVLTDEQIFQNFEAGVGERYFLLFNVSDHIDVEEAYVVFEVSQFDSFSYLFDEPFFIILDPDATPGNIPMRGLRVGVNGREVAVSQTFSQLDTTINDADYAAEGRQTLSTQGGLVPLERGPQEDEFFLTFELLGNVEDAVIRDPGIVTPPAPVAVEEEPEYGIRDFAEVNATMSKVTGVPITNARVATTYNQVQQALPVGTGIIGFISSQQMGVVQLALSYCSELVGDGSARADYFPGFNFNADVSSAFAGANRDLILDPLLNNMVGAGLATQPDLTETDALIDRLVNCGADCEADRTERVVIGACGSVLGSAAMMVQ